MPSCGGFQRHMRSKVDDVKSGFRVGSYRFLGKDSRSFIRKNI